MSEPTLPPIAPGTHEHAVKLEPTTLGELGDMLPHSHKRYRFNPANMGTLKKLGSLENDAKLTAKPGQFTAFFLASALLELDSQDMGPVGVTKHAGRILSLPTGDVFTLILAWKRACNPKSVKLGQGRCGQPGCGEAFGEIEADLADMQILALPEGAAPPVARVGLVHGFEFPAGQTVRTVLVQPPTWGATFGDLSTAEFNQSMAVMFGMALGAISGVDTSTAGRVPAEALEGMLPGDIELISEVLLAITPTPEMTVEVECPKCQATNQLDFNWRAAGFLTGNNGGARR